MFRLILMLAILTLPVACRRPTQNTQCMLNSDCASAQVCRAGSCVSGCDTDRDCANGQLCQDGQCMAPPTDGGRVDSGRRDAGGSSSGVIPGDGGLSGEEEPCGPTQGCQGTLQCVSLGSPAVSVCLRTCTASADGGLSRGSCSTGQKCWPTSGAGGQGACLRTKGRDESCMSTTTFIQDPLLVCEPGLTRLLDNPATASLCACKLLCAFSHCPGTSCECPSTETCIAGALNSTTQGVCGHPLDPGQACDGVFDYPFYSSNYCAIPPGVPQGATPPVPWCYFDNFTNFDSICQLICDEANASPPLHATCPVGYLCQAADPDVWGPGVKTCQGLGGGDAGVGDAGATDAGQGMEDGGLDGGGQVDAAADQDAGVDSGT